MTTASASSAAPASASSSAASVTAITWFEIPCADLSRAQAFYEHVLARPMQREDFGGGPMALFAHDDGATGGCLSSGPDHRVAPGAGVRIYLDCSPSLDAAVARIAPAGGQVVGDTIELPRGIGFIAHLVDVDGNTIGLHAKVR